MAENANVPAQESMATPQVNEMAAEAGVGVSSATYKDIVKKLVLGGAKRFNKNRIKNVTITECENYTRIALTLTNKVPGFVPVDGTDTFEKGMTNVVFVSLFALVAVIREDEDLAWMGNYILEHPSALSLVLCGGEVDLIQREYAAGEEVKNPYSSNPDAEGNVYDHDILLNDVVEVRLGKTGQKMADKLADKMFDL